MSLVLAGICSEAFQRYFSKTQKLDITPNEFHRHCAKLSGCDCFDEFASICYFLLAKIASATKPVSAFERTKGSRLLHVGTDVTYDADLISIPSSEDPWQILTMKESDQLVRARFFEEMDRVLFIPVIADKNVNYNLIFVVGTVGFIDHVELLKILVQHITSCYSRLHKQSKRPNEDTKYLASLFKFSDELHEDNATAMQVKIMPFLTRELNCQTCCLLIAMSEVGNLVCQVVGGKILETEYYCPLKGELFGNICRNRQPRIMQQFTTLEQETIRSLFKYDVRSLLCVPVISQSSQEVVALACACNKLDGRFTVGDVSKIQTCLRYTWPLLTSSIALQKERKVKDECQAMLQIAKNLFTHLDDVTILLGEIIQEARTLTNAERCSVFLVDKESNELVAKVFDGILTVDESLDPRQYDFEGMNEVRIPLSQGIAGHVATTGQALNIRDAYSHPLFYRGIDEATGFTTRNILCFPIKDNNGEVVGVSQLCNKIKGQFFTQYDVELAERFSVFSGLSISHSLLYKQVIEVQCRNQLANELMTYHMKISEQEVSQCLKSLPPDASHFHSEFSLFVYSPRLLEDELQCQASVQMFVDLGLVSRCHISTRTLARFVLMVKEGYRDPPYHNWTHAFTVAHHAYSLAENLDLCQTFGDLPVLALLTASFCHDLDHRGTNNAFQVSSQSTLAALYSSEGSVLERHHFAQAMCILNSGSCNIFENLSKTDYVDVLDMMKEIILATDVAHHLQIIPKLEKIEKAGFEPRTCSSEQKTLIFDLFMTACDLSDQTKDWKNTKNTAHMIYKEFFSQGDMEKSMGTLPAVINDRERACVPELQVNFMEHIARPAYRIIAAFFPKYQEVLDRFESNVTRWKLVQKKFKELGFPNTKGLDFLTEEFERDLFQGIQEKIGF